MGEHIIQCDDPRFVPLARSRIAAIRASGLSFGSQRFTVDGVTITVQVKGEQEYIRIEGGGDLLSGLIRNGDIIEVAGENPGDPLVETMHEFKPTIECGEYVIGKQPSELMDIKRLAVGEVGNKAYATTVIPSMYSGEMVKVVQILLGYGKTATEKSGRSVAYKHTWAECHGIVRGADNKPWLVYISQNTGVLAMRLPTEGRMTMDPRQKVITETKALFGGIPSGKDFPQGPDLQAKIDSGDILKLIDPTDQTLIDYFACNPYHADMGWSFNTAGSEAHNTCWKEDPEEPPFTTVTKMGHHYKIAFTIGAINRSRQPGDPIAVATAEITKVHTGFVVLGSMFYGPGAEFIASYYRPPQTIAAQGFAHMFVCHIGNEIHVIEGNSASVAGLYGPYAQPGAGGTHGVYCSKRTSIFGFAASDYYPYLGSIGTYNTYGPPKFRSPHTDIGQYGETIYYFYYGYISLAVCTAYAGSRNPSRASVVTGIRDAYLWNTGGGGSYQTNTGYIVTDLAGTNVTSGPHQSAVPIGDVIPEGDLFSVSSTYTDGDLLLVLPNGVVKTLPIDFRGYLISAYIWHGYTSYFDDLRQVYTPDYHTPYFPVTYADYGVEHIIYPKFVFRSFDQSEIDALDQAAAGFPIQTVFVRSGPLFTDVPVVIGDTFHFIGYVE